MNHNHDKPETKHISEMEKLFTEKAKIPFLRVSVLVDYGFASHNWKGINS
jgi:hypothetical protein